MADRGRRTHPSANKILTRRWDERVKKLHQERLSKIKASVDNKPPAKMKHLHRNLKREQIREERYSAIERENRILLEKMSHILHGKHGLDNKRKSKPRSMNRLVRRAELVRITNENQRILRKIQSSEPTYNHLTWEQERRAHEKYLRSLSEYDEFGREKALVKAVGRRAAGAMAGAGRPTSGRRRGRPASAPVRRVSGGADADAYGGAGAAAYGDGYGGPADASYGYDGDAGAGGGAGGRVEYRRGGGGRGGRARPQSAGPSHHSYAGRTDSLPTEDDAELGVIRDD